MAKKFELIGTPIARFEEMLFDKENKEIFGRRANLIPTEKKLNEASLASVFLATLTLVKEFREIFTKEFGLSRTGTLHAFTEVSFPNSKVYDPENSKKGPLRVDGLLLQVASGIIRDAVFLEFKMGKAGVTGRQISAYLNLAKEQKVTKLVSVSNQFVPSPTDYPVSITPVKDVNLFHFSWKHIITLGSVLLTKNETNISDPDQHAIMHEVIYFLRHPHAETLTFDSMSKGWATVVDGLMAEKQFLKTNECVHETALDWIQEEQDLALKIGEELGLIVDTQKKGIKDFEARINYEKEEIVKKGVLESQFRIKNAVSPITVEAKLGARSISCSVELKLPLDRQSSSAKLNWINRQLIVCQKRDPQGFANISKDLWIQAITKGRGVNPQHLYSEFDQLVEESSICELRAVRVSYLVRLAGKFTQSRKFIEEYEESVRSFYRVIVQNLKNWEPKAPKMEIPSQPKESVDESEELNDA